MVCIVWRFSLRVYNSFSLSWSYNARRRRLWDRHLQKSLMYELQCHVMVVYFNFATQHSAYIHNKFKWIQTKFKCIKIIGRGIACEMRNKKATRWAGTCWDNVTGNYVHCSYTNSLTLDTFIFLLCKIFILLGTFRLFGVAYAPWYMVAGFMTS